MTPYQAGEQYISERLARDEITGLDAVKTAVLLRGYDNRWKANLLRIISVEQEFNITIINPETGRASRTYQQGGKLDGLVDIEGRPWLLEHKTASEDINTPDASYWRRLAIDSQVSMYALANWQAGYKVEGTVYDVMKKPGIRPKKITQAQQKKLKEKREYLGYSCMQTDVEACEANEWRETDNMYGLRLALEIEANPERYFQRRTVPRMDNELIEFAGELWHVAKDIAEAKRTGRHYRNSGACMNYGRPCQYLGICSGHDDPESDRWRVRDSFHPEVSFGESVLTHSRIRCFQTCRRKHLYKYEMGLERVDDEESEALQFGSLWHKTLEAYFLRIKEIQDAESTDQSAITEIADSEPSTESDPADPTGPDETEPVPDGHLAERE